jgi:ABC-type Co2+ transport system permease subunit
MEEIKAPKKERKFLKAVGNIAKVLANELVMGIGRKFIGKAIDKVGKKRQGLVIAFALVAGISYASIDSIPYPITSNKQRLGFQTTGNGLVWRGTAADTVTKPTSYADKNIKAYLILDSVSGSLYVFKQGAWAISEGSTIDTVSLSNRINLKVNISDTAAMLLPYFKDSDTSLLNLISRFELKLNISDTASMLLPYATKEYADTTGRLYAREDFLNVSTSTLTWTQTDTLIPGGVTVVQVYRNGQILLPSQYTIPTSTSVVIAETSFKVNDNYTVIFPRGGGAGSGGGSGSLTSITAGTGIVVSPNPITTTGTVSADLTVMMELTDTTLLNLTTRFATKQNNITLTTTGTSGASTLVGSTLNIPQYTGGSGTVTSVGSGYGLLGGPITTTGTLTVDTSTVYDFVRDSIVAVEIGGDTIKIIKQEYIDVTNDTLVFTILPKFPIQLRQFILLFRNGQLLLNDQFSIIDTNKVKVAASSFKLGENYTLVTVSGIGSVSSGQGNPVYPEAGIALSTGTTWTTSITNNSSNWNTAFTDRLKWDGGSTGLVAATGRTSLGGTTIGQSMFTLTNPSAITFPRFNADNTVTARTAANFRSDIGAGTVTSVNIASGTPMSITNNTTTPEISMAAATGSVNGYLTSTDWTTFNGKQNTITLTTTGTSGAATLVGASLNIPQYTGGSGTVTNVSGTGAISVATGTTTPVISVATAAFGTAGIVSSSGTQQFSGDKVFEGISQFNGRALFKDYTYVATRLAGLSSTDRFATVTIGSGLSLSSGTLSATGGGVTSVTASSPLSSSGGATPNITITDAGAAASGVVNTTTQSFAGNKTFTGTLDVSSTGTFGGRVKTNWLERNYAYSTSSSFTVSVNTTWQDINTSVLTTITLPNAATYPGKELHLRQTGAGSVQSASSNIIPFLVAPTGSTSNGILIPAGNVRAATLVSDGDNWIIMQRNN